MLKFRPAMTSDIPLLDVLVNRAYRGDSSRLGWTTEADLLGGQRIDEEMLFESVAALQIRLGFLEADFSRPACCYELKRLPSLRSGESVAYLGLVTVEPSLQNRGLGKEILIDAERIARMQWGVDLLEITVIEVRAELVAWYQRHGFQRTEELRPFHQDDPRFGIPKVENLQLRVLRKRLG